MLLSLTEIFFPYNHTAVPFEVEQDRFYPSNSNIIFVDKSENSKLAGIIINKNSVSRNSAETYTGNYSVSEDMVLKLQGIDNKYIVAQPNPYRKFFNFFIKISSFIAESLGKTEKQAVKVTAIKTVSIIITISAISFFFSTGKWPLINYLFSQFFVICFIGFNFYIQRIQLPQFLQDAGNLIPFNNGIYYFTYIVFSLCILLIKILSLKVNK